MCSFRRRFSPCRVILFDFKKQKQASSQAQLGRSDPAEGAVFFSNGWTKFVASVLPLSPSLPLSLYISISYVAIIVVKAIPLPPTLRATSSGLTHAALITLSYVRLFETNEPQLVTTASLRRFKAELRIRGDRHTSEWLNRFSDQELEQRCARLFGFTSFFYVLFVCRVSFYFILFFISLFFCLF